MSQWDDVSIDDLDASEAAEHLTALADIAGLNIVKQIVQAFGGESIYIPKPESITRRRRDHRIYERFNGRNYRELAREYRLSLRQVRNIIRQKKKEKNGHVPKQKELF